MKADFRIKIFATIFFTVPISLTQQFLFRDLIESMLHPFYNFGRNLSELLVGVTVPALVLSAVFGSILAWYTTPLARAVRARASAIALDHEAIGRARRILFRLPRVTIILNLIGYTLGIAFDVVVNPDALASFKGLHDIALSLSLAAAFTLFQVSLNELFLAGPRKILQIHRIEAQYGEKAVSSFYKKMRNGFFLVFYGLMLLTNISITIGEFQAEYSENMTRLALGDARVDQLELEYVDENRGGRFEVPAGNDFVYFSLRPDPANKVLMQLLASLYIVAIVTLMLYLQTKSEILQIRTLRDRLAGMARGEVGTEQKIEIMEPDEIGLLTQGINETLDHQNQLVQKISSAAAKVSASGQGLAQIIEQLTSSVEEMAATSTQMSQNAQQRIEQVEDTRDMIVDVLNSVDSISENVDSQASFVEETSAAMTEMMESIKSVASNLEQASQLASSLEGLSQVGAERVGENNSSMEEIQKATSEVSSLVKVISSISAQTNLLAMNAAIEAAHAGDAGRGFAVVAEEVRDLANNSASSAKTILSQMKSVLGAVGKGSDSTGRMGEAFHQIKDDVEKTTSVIQQISAAMQQQNAGTNQILSAIGSLISSTEEIRGMTQMQKEKNQAMTHTVDRLIESFEEILQGTTAQQEGNQQVLEASYQLKELSGQTTAVIAELNSLIPEGPRNLERESNPSPGVPETDEMAE